MDEELTFEPSDALTFIGPFTTEVTAKLTIRNKSKRTAYFKIKATAHKKYCITPDKGILEPGASTSIDVKVKELVCNPKERKNHKFKVKSFYASGILEDDQDTLWKNVPPPDLRRSKIPSIFVMPEDNQQSNSKTRNLTAMNNEELFSKTTYLEEENKQLKLQMEHLKETLDSYREKMKKTEFYLSTFKNQTSYLHAELESAKYELQRLKIRTSHLDTTGYSFSADVERELTEEGEVPTVPPICEQEMDLFLKSAQEKLKQFLQHLVDPYEVITEYVAAMIKYTEYKPQNYLQMLRVVTEAAEDCRKKILSASSSDLFISLLDYLSQIKM